MHTFYFFFNPSSPSRSFLLNNDIINFLTGLLDAEGLSPPSVLHSVEEPKLFIKPAKCVFSEWRHYVAGSITGNPQGLPQRLSLPSLEAKDHWSFPGSRDARASETKREAVRKALQSLGKETPHPPQKLSESQTLDPFTQIADSATTHRPEPSRSASSQRL